MEPDRSGRIALAMYYLDCARLTAGRNRRAVMDYLAKAMAQVGKAHDDIRAEFEAERKAAATKAGDIVDKCKAERMLAELTDAQRRELIARYSE